MTYIDRNLLPDEQILFRTRKHLIIFFYPVVVTIFALIVTPSLYANPLMVNIVWTPWAVAAILWFAVWLNYITSEFAITNRRVMMREGIFVRHSNEVRIATISQVNVEQSIFGQVLNYGTVSIHTFGAFDTYTMIANPGLFQQCVNGQLDKIAK